MNIPSCIKVCLFGLLAQPLSAETASRFFIDTLPDVFGSIPKSIEQWIYDPDNAPDLYLFLKETEQAPTVMSYPDPPPEFQVIFDAHTLKPITEIYEGYLKLHNASLSSWRPAIAWNKLILRVHEDDKVTGWILDETQGATYEQFKITPDISDAFQGKKTTDGKIHFEYMELDAQTKTGKRPVEGYNRCTELSWNKANTVLKGRWEGESNVNPRVNPKHQEGTVNITMKKVNLHVFHIQDALKALDADMKNRLSNNPNLKYDDYINSLFPEHQSSRPALTIKEQELLIAWYVTKAWDFYIGSIKDLNIKHNLQKEKNQLLDFHVYLSDQFHSDTQKGPVPMQFGRNTLRISTGVSDHTFWTQKSFWGNGDPDQRISKIAHEILGHGIFNRYYIPLIDHYGKLAQNNFKRVCEGLAVAVEYAVALQEDPANAVKNVPSGAANQPLVQFAKERYGTSDKKDIYVKGVQFIINQNLVDPVTGAIQWNNIGSFRAAPPSN